jgi:2-dehydropantoate 2-reductase
MRIAVMGSGGVGGYFGARLAAAGNEVHFIARGAHLAAMVAEGLKIGSPLGDLDLRPVSTTSDPRIVGPVDAVLFAVKLPDTETAAQACAPLLGESTGVFTFQNGVESAERIGRILGADHVVPGVCYIAATIAAPGAIRHTGTMARLLFNEAHGTRSARVEALLAACRAAGIDAETPGDIQAAIWQKFVRLAPFAGLTALTRTPIGTIRAIPDTRALLAAAVEETAATARAQGVTFGAETAAEVLAWFDELPEGMSSSMAYDLSVGKPLELPWLSGAVVRLGSERGVPTPTHRFICQALSPHQNGSPRP